jgi:hypothetical protein
LQNYYFFRYYGTTHPKKTQKQEIITNDKPEDLFFGTSITVTTENYHLVTSPQFIDTLRSYGCKIVFYIDAAKALGWEHTGGCTLFEHREEIEKMII